ncbi:hypothetical protein tb265_06820 [Gemmatimonadetes bacterium T265]|nr:hypothetical protein tb265_06820 [Gemmatimonadetes bacterium T265]
MSLADERFVPPAPERRVETPLLRRTINRTLDVRDERPFVIWVGPPGNGKTETARALVAELDAAFAQKPEHGFRARHFEVAQDYTGPLGAKRILRTIHHRVIGRLTDGDARPLGADDLAQQVIDGMMQRHVQILCIDEAGLLSMHALRGLCLLRTEAENRRWPLTVVLIGMDDLPDLVARSPQVYRRVHQWCHFTPYDFEDTWAFLAAVHPHFALLRRDNPDHLEQVTYLHAIMRGLPGDICPFLRKLDAACAATGGAPLIDLTLLRAVYALSQMDERRALDDWKKGWLGRGRPSKPGTPTPTAPAPNPSAPERSAPPPPEGDVTKPARKPPRPPGRCGGGRAAGAPSPDGTAGSPPPRSVDPAATRDDDSSADERGDDGRDAQREAA